MNILQIVPQIPYPLDNGGRIGIFNITKHLALRGHFIIMLALDKKNKTKELQNYCHLEVVGKNTKNNPAGMFFNLFTTTPYTISKYHSSNAERIIDNIIRREKIDIIHVDHLHMAGYGEYTKNKWSVPAVLREHNVETIIWERFYPLQNNLLKKAYAFLQYKKIKAYEKRMCRIFDRVFVITEDDFKRIKRFDPSIRATVITAGVDTSYFYPQSVKEESKSIAFVGSMGWIANIDGIQWFVKQIFPLIQRRSPGVKLRIIGNNPANEVVRLRSPDIDIIPNVLDIREYISKAEVVIVPLRIGGGMRLKILEALAMKKAVVSTSIGCEGINVELGREILVADDEETFAGHILRLFEDRDYREKLALQGYQKVLSKYSWEKIAKSLEDEYERVILEHRKIREQTLPETNRGNFKIISESSGDS
jgi:glycosyltransferase involved in cell wall biosynthesis